MSASAACQPNIKKPSMNIDHTVSSGSIEKGLACLTSKPAAVRPGSCGATGLPVPSLPELHGAHKYSNTMKVCRTTCAQCSGSQAGYHCVAGSYLGCRQGVAACQDDHTLLDSVAASSASQSCQNLHPFRRVGSVEHRADTEGLCTAPGLPLLPLPAHLPFFAFQSMSTL